MSTKIASGPGRYDEMPAVNVREDGSLELPILVSAFGESLRLRGTSGRQGEDNDADTMYTK